MLTEHQLANTRNFIGGSKAAAILGLSSYQTPLDVYNEIVHQIHDQSIDQKENVLFGTLLEDVIAQESARRLECEITSPPDTFIHKDYPWLIAHPDRLIVGKKEGLEIKNRSFFMSKHYGDEYEDQVMNTEMIQCQHYMNVLDYEKFHLCVLLGGQELKIIPVERNNDLISIMQEKLNNFWHDNILKQVPPAPSSLQEVNNLFKDSNAQTIDCDHDIVKNLREIKKQIKQLEDKEEALELEIKSYMKENEILKYNNKKIATWKTQERNNFDRDSFKKVYPDLNKKYNKITFSRVFKTMGEK